MKSLLKITLLLALVMCFVCLLASCDEHEHDLVVHKAKEPTCTEVGWNDYVTCTGCTTTTYQEIPALGHGEVKHDAKAPTCTEGGWDAYVTCSRCDYTTYAEKAALGHTESTVLGYSATCNEDGLTDGTVCSTCEKVLAEQSVIPAFGHSENAVDAKAPTCTEAGWDAYTMCNRCDYTTYEEIPALSHDEVAQEAKAPTCTEIGWDAYVTCSRCDYTTYSEKAALGHTEVVYAGYAATCIKGGLTSGMICDVCGFVTTERQSIPATGHKYDDDQDKSCNTCGNIRDVSCEHAVTETIKGYAATCTAVGLTDGRKCTECGEIVTIQITLPALGHSEVEHKAKAPTCSEIGWDAYIACSRCDYTTYVEKAALGHSEVEHEAKAPTCNEIGWDEYVTCTECDYTTYAVKAALGHNEIEHEAKAPTCNEIGWDEYVTCTECDYTTYVEKGKIPHSESVYLGYAATCTESGLADGVKCSKCGHVITEREIIPAAGHKYDNIYDADCNVCSEIRDVVCTHTSTEIIPGYDATCTVPGLTDGERCTKCREIVTIQITLPALAHNEVEHEAKAPTCNETGWDAYVTCSRCDYTTYAEKAALGHDYVGYSCRICGAVKPNNDLIYVPITDDTCYVAGTRGGESTLVIPSVAPDGRTVVGIGNGAFNGNYSITHVILPDTILSIGDSAFMGCSYLISVSIPEGVTEIGEYAFFRCSISEIDIPDSVNVIGEYAFSGCFSLASAHIGSGVTKMGDSAFYGCDSLKEISISEGVTEIGARAFANCYGIKSIVVPSTVVQIGEEAFKDCYAIESITLPFVGQAKDGFGATNFGYIFGAPQFTPAGSYVPASLSTVIITGGTVLDQYAFMGCYAIKSITLPDTLNIIGTQAFDGCSSLTSIVIPVGVTDIRYKAFFGCPALVDITVAEGNGNYCSVDGNLYSKDKTVLTTYAPGKTEASFSVLEGVIKIEDGAFANCEYITRVTFPTTLMTIGYNAFYGCSSLRIIDLEGGVMEIIAGAFEGCPIVIVNFNGSPEDFNNINGAEEALGGAQLVTPHFCTPGQPVIENEIPADCYSGGWYELVTYCADPECPNGRPQMSREYMNTPALGHDEVVKEAVKPTCTEYGWNEHVVCTRCSYTTYEKLPALGHDYVDGICSVCKRKDTYTREDNYIYFGEYPQTVKSDDVTITDTRDERGYYLGSDNCYYAKVVAIPQSATYTFSNGDEIEYDKVYYFKVEPIRWKILTESDGKAFLLCDSIIANMAYDGTTESHCNNYAESDIRAWLNEEFYNNAFGEFQKEIILTTLVDNSVESTGNSSNAYVSQNTEDKVFLLSGQEAQNESYGFSYATSSDYIRWRKSSDYARAMGVWMSTGRGYVGNGYWWLRSPFYNGDKAVYQINAEGKLYESYRAAYANNGVVPALWIKL